MSGTIKTLLVLGGVGWTAYLLYSNIQRDKAIKQLNSQVGDLQGKLATKNSDDMGPVPITSSQMIPGNVLKVYDTSIQSTLSKPVFGW